MSVTCDGVSLDPRLDLRSHSPDGFEFGYAGSGPAQLALAILAHATGDDELALAHHQKFKFETIATLSQSPWRITQGEVRSWIARVLASPTEPGSKPVGESDAPSRSAEPRADPTYQGWADHATWAVHLWLNNDAASWELCRQLAEEAIEDADECDQVRDGIWTPDEARRFILADRLRDLLAEGNPLAAHPSAYADLLSGALEDVDYHELADAFLEDMTS